MEIKLDTVLERDIDLLILEEFIADKQFAKLFLTAANICDDCITVKAIHSKTDPNLGESDIVFILQINDKLHALHIEDKIGAIAMPEQHDRYHLRAKKDINNGEYDSYSVIIVAPQKYLEKNDEAKKYDHKVTYEQMLDFFIKSEDLRSKYKANLIEKAITEQGSGYQWKDNPHVVRFCTEMYKYQKVYFPGMIKGTVAWWPIYKTIHKGIDVWFKSTKGFCDLTFNNIPYPTLYKEYKNKINGNMIIVETGKSSAIRIEVEPIRFEDNFYDVLDDVHEALEAIKTLLDFGNSLTLKKF